MISQLLYLELCKRPEVSVDLFSWKNWATIFYTLNFKILQRFEPYVFRKCALFPAVCLVDWWLNPSYLMIMLAAKPPKIACEDPQKDEWLMNEWLVCSSVEAKLKHKFSFWKEDENTAWYWMWISCKMKVVIENYELLLVDFVDNIKKEPKSP